MIDSQLLCTFSNKKELTEMVLLIKDSAPLSMKKLYVLQKIDNPNELMVTYNVLKSALSISPQQKETQPENVSTMLSMLFSGGYNSTAADVATSKTISKKEGFSNSFSDTFWNSFAFLKSRVERHQKKISKVKKSKYFG